jgi:hypothetical protein
MNVPSTELQQYKGQWFCPICIADARSEESRKTRKKNDYPMTPYADNETCERCGRDLTTVYFYNGRKLCETCLKFEQDKWTLVSGEKPGTTPYKISLEKRKKSKLRKIFEYIFSEMLALLGVHWKPEEEPEIVPLETKKRRKQFSRPLMSEDRMKKNPKPESEGLMKNDEIVPVRQEEKKEKNKKIGKKKAKKKKSKKKDSKE